MNETEFRIDVKQSYKIIIKIFNKRSLTLTDSDNRKMITSIKCINEEDIVISSMIIVADKQILHR